MKRTTLLSNAAARLLRSVVVCLAVAAASPNSFAQTQTGEPRPPAPPRPTRAAEADEEFDLNIEQRRITEKEFRAETAVETDGARGVRVGVGVALRASDIEVLLLGVRGHVRFRGSLAPVLRMLEARRGAPAQSPPP